MNEILKQIQTHCPKCKRRVDRYGIERSASKVWYIYYCEKCNINFKIGVGFWCLAGGGK